MSITPPDSSRITSDAYKATETFVQNWIKARIDEPANVMAGYNDAARQLIGVSGLLQGVYLAVFTFGDLKGSVPLWFMLPLFLPLLSVVFCAATVLCTVPRDFNVHRVFQLLRGDAQTSGVTDEIASSIKSWCESMDAIATKKRHWLHAANLSFVAASAVTAFLLAALAMMRLAGA